MAKKERKLGRREKLGEIVISTLVSLVLRKAWRFSRGNFRKRQEPTGAFCETSRLLDKWRDKGPVRNLRILLPDDWDAWRDKDADSSLSPESRKNVNVSATCCLQNRVQLQLIVAQARDKSACGASHKSAEISSSLLQADARLAASLASRRSIIAKICTQKNSSLIQQDSKSVAVKVYRCFWRVRLDSRQLFSTEFAAKFHKQLGTVLPRLVCVPD